MNDRPGDLVADLVNAADRLRRIPFGHATYGRGLAEVADALGRLSLSQIGGPEKGDVTVEFDFGDWWLISTADIVAAKREGASA